MSCVIPTSILFSIPHLVLKLAQQMVEKLADAYNGCQRTKHAYAAANGPDHAAAHNAGVHAAIHPATHNAAVHAGTHAAAHNATAYAVYP